MWHCAALLVVRSGFNWKPCMFSGGTGTSKIFILLHADELANYSLKFCLLCLVRNFGMPDGPWLLGLCTPVSFT